MALSRRLGVIAILSSCWFVAVACGDDAGKKGASGDAGAGGEGEGGDKSGSGGSMTSAGKGGAAAGTAGQTIGGMAGSGEAGSGGEAPLAGAAGDGGTGPGVGGEGGASGGAGGEGGAPVVEAKACAWSCETDADCVIPAGVDSPPDTSRRCDPSTKTCVDPSKVCQTKLNCVPASNFWSLCDDDEGCFEGQACVAWDGRGWCASLPDPDGCFVGVSQTLPRVGAQGEIAVCIEQTWTCLEGECIPGCEATFGCSDEGATCNVETGFCECTQGTDCNSGVCLPDGSCAECAQDDDCASGICGADGQCVECATNVDCVEFASQTGKDICVNGKCGCSGVDQCPEPGFTNALAVCQ